MSWWKILTGDTVTEAVKTVGKVADHSGTFIDKMFHTSQEKAEGIRNYIKDNMNMSTIINQYNDAGKSLSRRIIAFAFTGSYLIPLWVGSLLETGSIWYKPLKEVSVIWLNMANSLDAHVAFIFYFYFGYYGALKVGVGLIDSFKGGK